MRGVGAFRAQGLFHRLFVDAGHVLRDREPGLTQDRDP